MGRKTSLEILLFPTCVGKGKASTRSVSAHAFHTAGVWLFPVPDNICLIACTAPIPSRWAPFLTPRVESILFCCDSASVPIRHLPWSSFQSEALCFPFSLCISLLTYHLLIINRMALFA